MSITQTYYLAHKARAKLSREAAQPDHDLRLLVGHANLLDSLMLELAEAEQEQERWFNQSVRVAGPKAAAPVKASDRHVQWADRVEPIAEEYDDDSDSSSDSDSDYDEDDVVMVNAPLRPAPQPIQSAAAAYDDEYDEDMTEDDLEEDYSQLELVRTHSHSNSPPELVIDHEEDSSSDDEASMPPSPPEKALAFSQDKAAQEKSEQNKQDFYQEGEEEYYMPARNPASLVSTISVY
jgi:superfamily II RNA helicase